MRDETRFRRPAEKPDRLHGEPAGLSHRLSRSVAREVLRSMLLHKLRLTILTLLALVAVATGAGFLTQSLAMNDEPKGAPAGPQPKDANPAPAPGRMLVTGRV